MKWVPGCIRVGEHVRTCIYGRLFLQLISVSQLIVTSIDNKSENVANEREKRRTRPTRTAHQNWFLIAARRRRSDEVLARSVRYCCRKSMNASFSSSTSGALNSVCDVRDWCACDLHNDSSSNTSGVNNSGCDVTDKREKPAFCWWWIDFLCSELTAKCSHSHEGFCCFAQRWLLFSVVNELNSFSKF